MIARILPPRVALVDPRTGTIAREWYLYFLSLNQEVGTMDANIIGFAPSVAPVDVAAVAQDAVGLLPSAVPIDMPGALQDSLGIAPQADIGGIAASLADQMQYGLHPSTADLAARVAALESIINDLRLGAPVL